MTRAPLVLDAAAVAARIGDIDALAEMRTLFLALGRDEAVQPPQTLTPMPGDAGDFITYLGAIGTPPVFGAKLSPYIVRPDGALVTAWTLLMDGETGQPLMLCDAAALTTERTAATTALAVDLLAPRDATTLAIIGTGKVGQAHLRHVAALRPWHDIRLWSLGADARPLEVKPPVKLAPSLAAAADGAEVVMLCTSAASAIFDPRDHPACRLTTSISTNAPNAHEIPPAALAALDVYCDRRHSTPAAAAGEMILARALGWSADAIRGDLADLVSGACVTDNARPAFFRSVGLGCEDIAMAAALYRLVRDEAASSGKPLA